MKAVFYYILIVSLFSCAQKTDTKIAAVASKQNAAEGSYKWTKLTDSAAFPKSYNFQIFTVKDTVWVMHPAGIWYSTDGKNWMRSSLSNIIKNNAFLDYVWFKDALYCIGTFDGNIENYKLTSQIAKTVDFRNWQILAENSNLPKRFFYHPFVFKDKLWIIGGTDGTNNYKDVWTSDDAVHWTKIADSLSFIDENRNGMQFIVFNNYLYKLDNNVWRSEDGLNWKMVTGKISDETIFGYSPIVYDNKIWLIGCNRNGKFSSEILSSADGKNWLPEKAPWSPRGAVATCIFQNKILMTGGKYGGFLKDGKTTEFVYSNDVWAMEKNKQ